MQLLFGFALTPCRTIRMYGGTYTVSIIFLCRQRIHVCVGREAVGDSCTRARTKSRVPYGW